MTVGLDSEDLAFLKNAVMQAEWFLTEKDVYGEAIANGAKTGMQIHLHALERMNTYIEALNRTPFPNDKSTILGSLKWWRESEETFKGLLNFLDSTIKLCGDFIREKS